MTHQQRSVHGSARVVLGYLRAGARTHSETIFDWVQQNVAPRGYFERFTSRAASIFRASSPESSSILPIAFAIQSRCAGVME